MIQIAIFASGNGSNAENIIKHFANNDQINCRLILSNNPKAGVLERAKRLNVPFIVFNRESFYKKQDVLHALQKYSIDFIVLAGFMWLIPSYIIKAFPQKIVNIHPALLPKYGGKGMYGDFVHQAVSNAGETQTGISIHYVNDRYDEGDIIFQKTVDIEKGEEPKKIAEKVHALEYKYFPKIIERVLE